MARSLDDVLKQMAARGVRVPEGVDLQKAFSGYVRFRPEGEKRAKKSAWVRLFAFRSSTTGREYVSGAFGNRGDKWEVEATDNAAWSPAEREAFMQAKREAARASEAERQRDAQTAAQKAQRLWQRGKRLPPGDLGHPYLERKRVGAFGLRLGFNARLMVPLSDLQGTLQGLQYISPDGEKIFGTGTAVEGHSHLIGELKEGVPLLAFGEGYATCASVHMAMQWPVVVCFNAGGLAAVIAQYRRLYPELPFVILADDDRHLLRRLSERLGREGIVCSPAELRESMDREWRIPDGPNVVLLAGWKGDGTGVMRIEGTLRVGDAEQQLVIENAGQAKAHAAGKRFHARVLTPFFVDRESAHTDWNDLHCSAGLESVVEQINASMAAAPEKPGATQRAPRGGKKGAAGDGDGEKGRRRGKQPPGQGEGDTPFLERFTLIYGTTTVWDGDAREIVRLEALKVAFGKEIDWWLADWSRRMVPQANVVFDPSGQCKAPEYVNLFDRLPVEPVHAPDKCARIVEHLWNLCKENDDLCHWVTAWLAYPLQYPGAKMRTALVLHGRTEGTGKSTLGQIMRRIYGRYATSVGQAELQRDFNDWLSARLLVLAEEVVSRADRAHHQGMLQALITQPTVQINAKQMPLREEANHANFIFFSNQQEPVRLNPTDRRFTVIRVEQQQPAAYFKAIEAELNDGGAEAFYRYLLDYDLQGFDEFTRPFETEDRTHLITLGMSPDQRFVHYWRSGFAGVPFCCCPASDLYGAFKSWCRLNGERFVPTSTQFGRTVTEELERLGAPPKRSRRYDGYSDKQISDGDFKDDPLTKQGIVYFVPAKLERLTTPTGDEPRAAVADEPGACPNVLEAAYFNSRIKLFQVKLHDLLAAARRAL